MALTFRKQSAIEKYADFLGDEKDGQEGLEEFGGRVVDALGGYKPENKLPAVDLSKVRYVVTARDDHKLAYLKSKGQDVDSNLVPIGTVKPADEVLIGKMSRENPPQYFIDGWGNVFCKSNQ